MRSALHRRDDRHPAVEERGEGLPKRQRGELHLPELVDDRDVAFARLLQHRDRQPLERSEVDAVAPDARWAGELDAREQPARAAEAREREAKPPTAPADPLRDEPGHRNSLLA